MALTPVCRRLLAATGLVPCLAVPLAAQLGSGSSGAVTGYVFGLAGFQDLGYDPVVADRRTAFGNQVVRLKWSLELNGKIRIAVHNRIQGSESTARRTSANVIGLGVSAVPNRAVDLETDLIDEPRVRVWHDIDRLSATIFLDAADITIGRQAVTWGISTLFPVADLWAQFSPFELDTEEKPGIDAVRALAYPAGGVELDAVLADRGTARDLSAGVRATIELPIGDVYAAAGKFWRELIALAGVSVVLDEWKVRAEAAVPWDLDADRARALRATVGADWISADLTLSFELHRNGLGTATAAEYGSILSSPEFARGESYYLGRHFGGVSASYLATDRLRIAVATLANLDDPSIAVTPLVAYDLGQFTRLSAGALVSAGDAPSFAGLVPEIRSEFGTYGRYGYTRVSLYF